MLGKLLKRELKSYRLQVGITFLVAAVITVFMKVISMLPMKDPDGKIFLQMFTYMGYTYLIALVGFALQIFVITRFYNTMLSDRAYLTFTLPVKTSTHIWSKLLGGVIWQLIGSVFVILCQIFFRAGHYWTQEVTEVKDMMKIWAGYLPDFEAKYIVPIVLAVLLVFLWNVIPVLIVYMCMAIGQLFGKWRIFASIASFIIIVIAMYVLLIAGVMGLVIIDPNINFDPFVNASAYAIINIVLGTILVVSLIAGAICFAITNRLFDKHLNLE